MAFVTLLAHLHPCIGTTRSQLVRSRFPPPLHLARRQAPPPTGSTTLTCPETINPRTPSTLTAPEEALIPTGRQLPHPALDANRPASVDATTTQHTGCILHRSSPASLHPTYLHIPVRNVARPSRYARTRREPAAEAGKARRPRAGACRAARGCDSEARN